MNNNEFIVHEFMNKKVRQRIKDGYFSATDLCKIGTKRIDNTVNRFLYSEKNKKFLKCLEEELNKDSDKKIKVVEYLKIGSGYEGTMIHPAATTYLATWISDDFSVKVTMWIEEWRKTDNNNYRYIKELCNLESSYRKEKEREYEIQLRLAKELNAEIEVKTPTGFIDLLNDESIIEIKRYMLLGKLFVMVNFIR
jgi:KilA-N domain